MHPGILSAGTENGGHSPWSSMWFWPFWVTLLGNLVCPHNNTITKFAPNMDLGILLVGNESGCHWPRSSMSLGIFDLEFQETACNVALAHWTSRLLRCYSSQCALVVFCAGPAALVVLCQAVRRHSKRKRKKICTWLCCALFCCGYITIYFQGLFTERTDVLPQDIAKSRHRDWDGGLDFSNRCESWQASRQLRCRDACQISLRHDHYNTQSRGFETSRDLAGTHLNPLWIEAPAGVRVIYSGLHHANRTLS